MKTICITIIALILGMVIGYLYRDMYIENEIWKKEQLQEIEKYSKPSEDKDKTLEIINYKGDDWLEVWLEYLQQQESDHCHPV